MPSSFPDCINDIVQLISRIQPTTVLDIGPGRGKYGLLLDEYFGHAKGGDGHWGGLQIIDCCEVFEDYITDVHRTVYDNIYIGNALEYEHGDYDLYLLIDIIEHFPKEEGHKLLEKLVEKGDVLVSTPRSMGEQGEVFGNKWETHVAQWLPVDFEKYHVKEIISNHCSFMYLLCK